MIVKVRKGAPILSVIIGGESVFSLMGYRTLPICSNGQSMGSVYQFVYVGTDGGIELRVYQCIYHARSAFAPCIKSGKCSYLNTYTKIMLRLSYGRVLPVRELA